MGSPYLVSSHVSVFGADLMPMRFESGSMFGPGASPHGGLKEGSVFYRFLSPLMWKSGRIVARTWPQFRSVKQAHFCAVYRARGNRKLCPVCPVNGVIFSVKSGPSFGSFLEPAGVENGAHWAEKTNPVLSEKRVKLRAGY